MSEPDNIEVLRKMYADCAAGDILGVLNAMVEEVIWRQAPGGPAPFAGTIRGREQLDQWFRQTEAVREIEAFEPQEFIAQGSKVVVLGRCVLRSKATGKLWESDWAHVWTFKGRRVIECRVLENTLAQAVALGWISV